MSTHVDNRKPDQNVSISIALVTRDRPESLERCLSSWRGQSVEPLEIIVSDDSSPEYIEKTKAAAARFGARYIEGPRRGLYANRNHAALAAGGTHILTDDDDHTHPTDYLEKVRDIVKSAPDRIWAFAELSNRTDFQGTPTCPPELHRSGAGQAPADPLDCAAIADGSTAYPRQVFESGLRYDETYRFGSLWYLWGKVLKRSDWRISYSDRTIVYHHEDIDDRLGSVTALKENLECMTYVLFVNALWVNPSPVNLFWSTAYLVRRMLVPDSIVWYRVKARLGPLQALRLIYLAITYPLRVAPRTSPR